MSEPKKIIAIGGSAGSLPVVLYILQHLPKGFITPVVIIQHRLKNSTGEINKIVHIKRPDLKLKEPDDKEPVAAKHIYIAPANYHLLIESDLTFSLDYSEPVNYSRPSIDVSLESIAAIYGPGVTAILLSGANTDGADGISAVLKHGGVAIVQDEASSEYPVMPAAAIRKNPAAQVLTPDQVVKYLEKINSF